MTPAVFADNYATFDALVAGSGLSPESLKYEMDWGMNGVAGAGLPGGSKGGWMVCLHSAHWPGRGDGDIAGWLIARSVGEDHDQVGHRIMIAGPFTEAEFQASSRAFFRDSRDQPSIEELVDWLRRNL